jgi:hypothetical protein
MNGRRRHYFLDPAPGSRAAPGPEALLGAQRIELCRPQTEGAIEFLTTRRRNVRHGKTRWASTFIDRSYPWQALYLANEICEQRRGIVPSPHESQRQKHVQIDHA